MEANLEIIKILGEVARILKREEVILRDVLTQVRRQ